MTTDLVPAPDPAPDPAPEPAWGDLDEAGARRLTTKIQLVVESVNSGLDKLADYAVEAWRGRAHAALGYSSWDAYVEAEIPKVRFGRDERSETASNLAAEGMSTRAIAAVLGVGDATVRRDLDAVAPDDAPAGPRLVTGVDGKRYTVATKAKPAATVADVGAWSTPAPQPEPPHSARIWQSVRGDEPAVEDDPRSNDVGANDLTTAVEIATLQAPAVEDDVDEVVEAEIVDEPVVTEQATTPKRERKPKTERAPRVNVESVMHELLVHAIDAAEAAATLTPARLKTHRESAAVWHAQLAPAVVALQQLVEQLEGVNA